MRFVSTDASNAFSGVAATSDWSDTANWSSAAAPTSAGVVALENVAGSPQTVTLSGGTPYFTHSLSIGGGSGSGQSITLSAPASQSISATTELRVRQGGELQVAGGRVASGSLAVETGGAVSVSAGGRLFTGGAVGPTVIDGLASQATLSVDGIGSQVAIGRDRLVIGQAGQGTLSITGGGVTRGQSGEVGQQVGASGTVSIDGAGSIWRLRDELYVGGDASAAGGVGQINLTGGGLLEVGNRLQLWDNATLTIDASSRAVVGAAASPGVAGQTLYLQQDGVLSGVGQINGHVEAAGRITPGSSPGRLTIIGDFNLMADGLLEIEVGGLTPETQHDVVDVSGTATINGVLEFPLINSFVPTLGDTITFLNAGSIAPGSSPAGIFAPGLDAVNDDGDPNNDLAVLVRSTDTALELEYVDKATISFTDATNATADWFVAGGWNTGVLPDSIDGTTITSNLGADAQRVEVTDDLMGANRVAQVHSLTVQSGGGTTTLAVLPGNRLESAVGDVVIDSGGRIILEDGELRLANNELAADNPEVQVQQGGVLAGFGTVTGDISVGGGVASPAFALSQASATSGPTARFEVGDVEAIDAMGDISVVNRIGEVSVAGDYSQGEKGVLAIDLLGTGEGEFGTVVVSGDAQLAGTLEIDASMLTDVEAGDVYTVLTSDTVTGRFDDIEVIDTTGVTDGFYFAPFYGSTATDALGFAQAGTEGVEIGGMWRADGDAVGALGITEEDATVFAAVLIDIGTGSVGYGEDRSFEEGTPSTWRAIFDIPGFADAMGSSSGISTNEAYATIQLAIERAGRPAVPEPSTISMLGGLLVAVAYQRRRA